jgi:putative iron-dependent peroxidase
VAGMAPSKAPKALHAAPDAALPRRRVHAADTHTDLIIQICSNVKYANYACADSLLNALARAFSVTTHHQGFGFPGSRGALRFIDGTGNPRAEAKPDVALIGAEEPAFQGGSYMTFLKV